MNKQIMVLASVIFAVMFIAVISLLVSSMNSKGLNTSGEANSTFDVASNAYSFDSYNGRITGSELINLIHYYSRVKDGYDNKGRLVTVDLGDEVYFIWDSDVDEIIDYKEGVHNELDYNHTYSFSVESKSSTSIVYYFSY